MPPGAGATPQQQECEAFLTFVGVLVSLVLPIALLVASELPSSLIKWEEGEAARSSAAAATAAARSPTAGSQFGLRAACCKASTALEGAVRQLCGRSWLAPAPALGAAARQVAACDGGAEAALAVIAAPPAWQRPLLLMREQQQPAGRLDGWRRGLAWWLLLSFLWGASVATA